MVGTTYFKETTKKLKYKHYQMRKILESSYPLMQVRVNSELPSNNNDLDKTRYFLHSLFVKSFAPYLINSVSKKANAFLSIILRKEQYKLYKENIDWTRGRFQGKTVHIVVKNGQILEKVFLTPKGNHIIVNRRDLGLFIRILKIK